MKLAIASALSTAATLAELLAACLWLIHSIVAWTPPLATGDETPFELWADSEGRGPLASLRRGGSGMA